MQIAAGKALHLRKFVAQVGGEAVDHLRAPPVLPLPLYDLTPDLQYSDTSSRLIDKAALIWAERMRSLRSTSND